MTKELNNMQEVYQYIKDNPTLNITVRLGIGRFICES